MQQESANGRAHQQHHELVAAKLRKLLLADRGVHTLQRLLVLGQGVHTMLLTPVVHMALRMGAVDDIFHPRYPNRRADEDLLAREAAYFRK